MAAHSEVHDLVRWWQAKLGLSGWSITVELESLEDRGQCEASPEYREAKIKFDPTRLEGDDVEATVVHELLHCYVEPLANIPNTLTDEPALREWIRCEEEGLVTRLQQLILGVAGPMPR